MATRRQEVIEDCRYELSVNFQKPAIEIIAQHGARLGLTFEKMARLIDEANDFQNFKTETVAHG